MQDHLRILSSVMLEEFFFNFFFCLPGSYKVSDKRSTMASAATTQHQFAYALKTNLEETNVYTETLNII